MAEFDDKSWHTPRFVEQIIVKLDTARENVELEPDTKPSTEMEDFIFKKAETREEYMALIARLIMYFKSKAANASSPPAPLSAAKREELNNRFSEIRQASLDED